MILKFYITFGIFLFFGFTFNQVNAIKLESFEYSEKYHYPEARRDENIVENVHGINISDPYRWLENPNSEETKQFIEAENKFSQSFLNADKVWQKINDELTSLWEYETIIAPFRYGKYYFSITSIGMTYQTSLDAEPKMFLGKNELPPNVFIRGGNFSPDGSLFAYQLSLAGSDWAEIRIRDVETGKDYPDVINYLKFNEVDWTEDNKGFFYKRYDTKTKSDGTSTERNEYQTLYYHRLGETQDKDVLILQFPENPLWRISQDITIDGKYLIIKVDGDDERVIKYIDLEEHNITEQIPLKPILTTIYEFIYVANIGSKVLFRTNHKAPNFRLVIIDLNDSREENWKNFVEEDKRDSLKWAKCVDNDKIVASYLHIAKTEIRVFSLHTGDLIKTFNYDIGTVGLTANYKYPEVFFDLESFFTPRTIYRYDFSTPNIEPTIYYETPLSFIEFKKNDFIVDQVFYPGYGGARIPMFIVQKMTNAKGPKPTLLYGYGGFGVPLTPEFDPEFLYFINKFDGILAIPNIRGGGEFGESWHDGGREFNKQTSFNDFQAAAEYLIEQNYTVPKKIAIFGQSNGGLMVSACINQRPDLFGVAITQVGLMDMVRFPKFTVGHLWYYEYGNPEYKIAFDNIYKYSPLHNIRAPNDTDHQYPSTLILTGDHDDRVCPLHSLKFAAELQHELRYNEYQTNPILLKVYKNVGHNDGKSKNQKIREATDILTFLYRQLHIDNDIEMDSSNLDDSILSQITDDAFHDISMSFLNSREIGPSTIFIENNNRKRKLDSSEPESRSKLIKIEEEHDIAMAHMNILSQPAVKDDNVTESKQLKLEITDESDKKRTRSGKQY